MKAFIWDIRYVKSHQDFNRVQMIHKHHKFSYIALLEPFQRYTQMGKYKRRLSMEQTGRNYNGKIQYVIEDNIGVEVVTD